MTGTKSVFSVMCENVGRVFVDNPLAGVANILLIFVLFLAIIALIGVIFKKKDQSVGEGFLRPIKGIMAAMGFAAIIVFIRDHYIIAGLMALIVTCASIAIYVAYKRYSDLKNKAGDALDSNRSSEGGNQVQNEELQSRVETTSF